METYLGTFLAVVDPPFSQRAALEPGEGKASAEPVHAEWEKRVTDLEREGESRHVELADAGRGCGLSIDLATRRPDVLARGFDARSGAHP